MSPTEKPPSARTTKTKATPKTPAGPVAAPDSFGEVCTIRIELRDTDPLIWREVEVPTSITLKDLNDVVQITMGWLDAHLWELTVGIQRYGLPMDDDWGIAPCLVASKVRLRDVLKSRKITIDYLYDFGDCWEHRLTVTKVRPGDPGLGYPRYIAGEYAGPPEDCGGILGFYNMLDALADPTHPDHDEVKEYLEDYDLNAVDELPIKVALGNISKRRKAGRVRHSKPIAPDGSRILTSSRGYPTAVRRDPGQVLSRKAPSRRLGTLEGASVSMEGSGDS